MEMRNVSKCVLILAALVLAQSADAQDDKWWQKLFKKRADQSQQDRTTPNTQPDVVITEEMTDSTATSPTEVLEADTMEMRFDSPGTIQYKVDPGIDALDRAFKEDPPDVRGYRVQIFFGDLNPAREKRARFIASNPGVSCYLHQAAPNFGVRVGNFRDMEAAYRMLLDLKATYPNALIVPDKIEV